jgi:hypothetical protein
LLLGSVDLWAQTGIFFILIFGTILGCCIALKRGPIRWSDPGLVGWLLTLAALSGISCLLSPLRFYAVCGWRVWLVGFWVLGCSALIGDRDRRRVDRTLEATAWILVAWACYQMAYRESRYLGASVPFASLLNPNILAGAVLLLLPVASGCEDWLLCAGLLVVLSWTRSAGAWMGLIFSLAVFWRRTGFWGFLSNAAIAVGVIAAVVWKLRTPGVSDRWYWWVAAARMVSSRPWLGFGPGAFSYVMPAFWDLGRPLLSLYAHSHFLEVAAECGVPYMVLWISGVVILLKRGSGTRSVGVLALLFDSIWDYPLSIPAVLWLFCYCLGSCAALKKPEQEELPPLPNIAPAFSRELSTHNARAVLRVVVAGVTGTLVALGLAIPAWARWQSSRQQAIAFENIKEGADPIGVIARLDQASSWSANPEADHLAAEVELGSGALGSRKQRLQVSVIHLERSVALNPYWASSWTLLAQTYAELNQGDLARATLKRGAAYCSTLR